MSAGDRATHATVVLPIDVQFVVTLLRVEAVDLEGATLRICCNDALPDMVVAVMRV